MFYLIIYIDFCTYKHIMKLCQQHISKTVGTETCLPLCYITSSFNDTQSVWELRTLCVQVLKAEFFPILALYTSTVAEQSGVSVVIFLAS